MISIYNERDRCVCFGVGPSSGIEQPQNIFSGFGGLLEKECVTNLKKNLALISSSFIEAKSQPTIQQIQCIHMLAVKTELMAKVVAF